MSAIVFAQVEVDEQQVNLTRFSLLYPEKRDFFLEGRGLFDFPRSGQATSSTSVTPALFYSRRIGLNNGRVVPIDAGGRLTGKVGRYGIGVMNLATRDDEVSKTPRTDFTVVRVKRAGASNLVYGADAGFSFFQNVSLGGYWARSDTDSRKTDNDSYQARLEYTGDRYAAQAQHMKVGSNLVLQSEHRHALEVLDALEGGELRHAQHRVGHHRAGGAAVAADHDDRPRRVLRPAAGGHVHRHRQRLAEAVRHRHCRRSGVAAAPVDLPGAGQPLKTVRGSPWYQLDVKAPDHY